MTSILRYSFSPNIQQSRNLLTQFLGNSSISTSSRFLSTSCQNIIDMQKDYKIHLTTRHFIENKHIINDLGLVTGSIVKSRNIAVNFIQDFKAFAGYELTGLTELLNENREEALKRMIVNATEMKADSVVNIRFQVNSFGMGVSETFCSGTAVQTSTY